MPLPLVQILIGAVGLGAFAALALAASPPAAGDTVRSGTAVNPNGVGFSWRVKYTLNETTPYVAQVKVSGFGGEEEGWQFAGATGTADEAEKAALEHVAQRGEGQKQ